jgi:hypothetical protein
MAPPAVIGKEAPPVLSQLKDSGHLTTESSPDRVLAPYRVFLPKDAPWLYEFKVEVLAFPNGKHDDQVDSLSQFLSWIGNLQWRRRELVRPQTLNRSLGPPLTRR